MRRILLVMVIMLVIFCMPAFVHAQFVVTKSNDANINTSENGFFYSLPKTIFKIDLTYEIINNIKGPLADYAVQYLGTNKYIKDNSTFYRIVDVKVKPLTVADNDQTYWIRISPIEKSKEIIKQTFTLSNIGTLLAFDDIKQHIPKNHLSEKHMLLFSDNENSFVKDAAYNKRKDIDTIIRKITIDTVTINRFLFKTSWIDKTENEKADDAAKHIAKIRDARYNLLTGYHEVNFGSGIKYMDKQLQKLEHQYLELFLGKVTKSFFTQSFIFEPSKTHNNEVLFNYISAKGNHKSVTVNIKVVNKANGVPETSNAKIDNIYYRIPVAATLQINDGKKNIFNDVFIIPQFGEVSSAPLGKNKLHFDFVTGTLTKFKREQ